MILQTRELGFVDIAEADVLTFVRAIYGFEGVFRYVVLRDDARPDNPFMWLQCVENPEPCFVVLDPHIFVPDYRPELSPQELQELGASSLQELRFLALATVPHDVRKTSINLKCPVAVNFSAKKALQVIMESSAYSMRHMIFAETEG